MIPTVTATLALVLALLWLPARAGAETVRIYTHNDEKEMEAFVADLKAATGLDAQVLRMSSNELRARVVAEKGNIGADLQWGMPNSHALLARQEGLLEPYRSKEWEAVPARFKDPEGYWHGWSYWFNALALNTEIARKKGLPTPRTWMDLLDPRWKGEIVMPNPGTSGTAYLVVATLMQLWGEDRAWEYLTRLDRNVAEYTKSGSAPAEQVGRGQYALAITWDQAVITRKAKGYPLELIIPEEGVGFDLDSIAIFKGAKNLAAAKKVVDYVGSERGMRVVARHRSKVTRPGIEALVAFEPKLFPYDAARAGQEQDRIMLAWKPRFQK